MITTTNAKLDVLMARQGIYDEQNELFGYELLYRGQQFDLDSPEEQYSATIDVLSNLASFGVENRIDCSKKVFINISQSFLESPSFFPSNTNGLVLELLETIVLTPPLLRTIRTLKRQNFEFALDDYCFESHHAPLLPYVDYVKIDVQACPINVIETKIEALKEVTNATLLAEKIEDVETYQRCKELGFSLFQGFFIEKPKLIKGVKVNPNKQVVLKLLSDIARENITAAELSKVVSCDPILVTKVLTLVNSPLFSRSQKVTCLKQAIVTLGLDAVRKWLMVLLLVSESNSPLELFRILLARARLLELFAVSKHLQGPDEYFLLGLFSELDTVLELDMKSIVSSIPLSRALYSALLYKKGHLGELLKSCMTWERGIASETDNKDRQLLARLYWESQHWADELVDSVGVFTPTQN